ncbi:MAG: DUF983 domain-containing protein [Saprospiraceae bacterium]|nr:DUF983 domain-containing protein [Saprospiraceae bacterium]
MKPRSTIANILRHKCPRCQRGDLFETGSFSFDKPFHMPSGCPVCGQKYYPEPGYYYGAMFMSYIITSFFSLGLVGFCIIVLGWSVEGAFALLLAILAILFVWFFRTSRAAWIHMTVRFDEHAADGAQAPQGGEQGSA